uniref:RNase H type-1 domain-containing protein n=1 Tax=Nelumbo nucifera TaxID=4432 RepID=A0A822Z6T5_NELNU|nr:TPA_asm: hypothetical protein HUJ06_014663 [Nelumbo nucifera]
MMLEQPSLAGNLEVLEPSLEVPNSQPNGRMPCWTPFPWHGWCKVNCNAVYVKEASTNFLGCVVRNDAEDLLMAKGWVTKCNNPKTAKLIALRNGIRLAVDFGLPRVEFELDSKEAVTDIEVGQKHQMDYDYNLVADIRQESATIRRYSFTAIRRSANQVAHEITVNEDITQLSFVMMDLFTSMAGVFLANDYALINVPTVKFLFNEITCFVTKKMRLLYERTKTIRPQPITDHIDVMGHCVNPVVRPFDP